MLSNPFTRCTKILLLLQVTILFMIHISLGQNLEKGVTYREKNFTNLNDIIDAPVQAFYQDPEGFMWFGSNKKLLRFDGIHVKSFLNEEDTLINQLGPIREIIGIGEQEMLINMGSGIVRFNHQTGAYRTYTLRDLIPENEHPIYISRLNSLYFDKPCLWIGTNQGLLQYHLINEKPVGLYKIHGNYSGHLNAVKDIVPASEDLLWIAAPYGLYRFNKENKEFSQDLLTSRIPKNQLDLCMDRDVSGNLWIGHGGNLYFFDVRSGRLKMEVEDFVKTTTGSVYPDEPSFSNDSLIWNMRTSIHRIQVKDTQSIWIRTRQHIVDYNPESQVFTVIFSSEKKIMNREDPILEFFPDTDQNIWISEGFSGISYLYEYTSPIHFIRDRIEGSDKILLTAYNLDVFENGEVWVARHNGKGMARIDMSKGTIKEFLPNQLRYEITRRIIPGQDGRIWAIADGGIIYSCDPEQDEYKYYYCRDSISKRNQWFFTLVMDDYGNLWAGGAGGGLVNLDTKTGAYRVFNRLYGNSNGFMLMPVWQILKLNNGDLLILNNEEVIRLKISKKVQLDGSIKYDYLFSNYLDRNLDEIFKNRRQKIICGFIDSHQDLWLGTPDAGAVKYSSAEKQYTYYNKKSGLSSNAVTSITEDRYGDIWFTTDQGLSRLDPVRATIDNVFYWKESDYPFGAFDSRDAHQGPDGYLYFGVMGNPLYIDPADFYNTDHQVKKIVLSDLKVNNLPPIPGDKSIIPFLISYLPEVHLNHTHHLISVEFGVIDYLNTGKYQYRYKLEGYDRDWILAGQNTFLSYSNIPAGEYTLKVGYSDSEYFNEENSLALPIYKSPAPWNTVWAWLGYAFFILALGTYVISLIRKRMHMKHQLDLEHRQLEKVKELEEAKTRFFTQISHEIRTPLSLILQPVESLCRGKANGMETKYYQIIRRNAHRLHELTNQMLDISRLKSGKLSLKVSRQSIGHFLRLRLANFESMAASRRIQLDFENHVGDLELYFDRDMLEKVINNLLSNAIKYTPEGGCISVGLYRKSQKTSIPGSELITGETSLDSGQDGIVMVIKDTGMGISPAYHQKIFDHFYRVQEENGFEGMGIGLSLSRELVELHRGKIWVESSPGEGSSFFVFLPAGRSHFSDDQVEAEIPGTPSPGPEEEEKVREQAEPLAEGKPKMDQPVILFIEDNPDMQEYVRHELEEQYMLKDASNGEDGLQQAFRLIPDIIITDIMMPGMNGMEVCRRLKEDRRTRHIPVIMLTARATEKDKLSGLSTGADDYITKPFDIRELKFKIRNQLDQLKRLQERYIKAFLLNDPSREIPSRDEVFISDLLEVVNKNIENPAFSVVELSRKLGVSRTQLFRKLKALTGQQPNEFIRSVRMKKAAELLKKRTATVSEVAYDLGFNSLSYFSRCFKETYHVTPSEYMKNPSRHRDIDLSGS